MITSSCLYAILVLSLVSHLASSVLLTNITSISKDFLPNATCSEWDSFQNLSGCYRGQTLYGITKLKQYFHHFGYLPSSSTNFTNNFDDSLESAIKTYQRNFNLNVTGRLDPQTLQQIQRPRCGNADIINGSTPMNSGEASTPSHTVAHYDFLPGKPRWTKTQLTYAFLSENQFTDDVRSVMASAFDRWSEVTPLTFQKSDNYYTADIQIGFYSGDHGDGMPFDGVLGMLAHSSPPPTGRFHLDSDENWVVKGDVGSSPLKTAVDLESVAVHEIGHLLGLAHSSVEDAIMYPTLPFRTRKVNLASDDIVAVQQLYGSNPNYKGYSPSALETETSGAGFSFSIRGLWVLVAAELMLVFCRL